jgi:hypothetical protein
MNSQYLYLFLLYIKFKLVSFDEEARCLDRFPVTTRLYYRGWVIQCNTF